jgi:hypothetical protein
MTVTYRGGVRCVQTLGTGILHHRLDFLGSLQTDQNDGRSTTLEYVGGTLSNFDKHLCRARRHIDVAVTCECLNVKINCENEVPNVMEKSSFQN